METGRQILAFLQAFYKAIVIPIGPIETNPDITIDVSYFSRIIKMEKNPFMHLYFHKYDQLQ